MAESDAAGPAPARKRRLTIYDAVRQVERSAAPLWAAMEKAQRDSAPLRAAMEKAQRDTAPMRAAAAAIRGVFGDEEEDPRPQPTPAAAGPPNPAARPPAAPPPKPPPARPPFEEGPSQDLLAALREAFPGFKPTSAWWFHVEKELKTAHHRSNPDAHDAFCRDYRNWSAEDLRRHLEEEGRIPPRQRGRRRKRTVDNLDVHQWVMAMATADRSFRHLSQKEAEKLGPFKARTIGTSWAWIQMKADLETEAAENADRAKAELEDRLGEEDRGGFRQSSTKRGIGIQRPTRKDLEHERDVEAFLRAAAGKPRKKRAK
jgi:hypothetical protein